MPRSLHFCYYVSQGMLVWPVVATCMPDIALTRVRLHAVVVHFQRVLLYSISSHDRDRTGSPAEAASALMLSDLRS